MEVWLIAFWCLRKRMFIFGYIRWVPAICTDAITPAHLCNSCVGSWFLFYGWKIEVHWTLHCLFLSPLSHLPLPPLSLYPTSWLFLSWVRHSSAPGHLHGCSLFPQILLGYPSPPLGLRSTATFSMRPAYLEWQPAPTDLSLLCFIFLCDAYLGIIHFKVTHFWQYKVWQLQGFLSVSFTAILPILRPSLTHGKYSINHRKSK